MILKLCKKTKIMSKYLLILKTDKIDHDDGDF